MIPEEEQCHLHAVGGGKGDVVYFLGIQFHYAVLIPRNKGLGT